MQLVALRDWYPAIADKWTGRNVSWSDRTHWVHHHTVGGTGTDPLRYARQVADMHYTRWGVPGGYNVLVGTDGVLRAMCGLDHQGVHAGTREWNRRGVGIAYQGDFRLSPPSGRMLNAARELIAAHPLDQTTHRAVRPEPTTCPGDALIALLPLEVDMPLTNDDLQKVRQIIWFNADMRDYTTGKDLHAATLIRHARNDAYQAKVDAAVARRLMEQGALSSTPLTQSQVEAIAEAVRLEFAEALGG